jgi:hypothetical protein
MNKKYFVLVLLSVSALLIVLPVVRSVNVPGGNHFIAAPASVAEGDPMPLPPAKAFLAEGDPMPLPPVAASSTFIAEGDPMPLPPMSAASTLVAEGDPMPLPPAFSTGAFVV